MVAIERRIEKIQAGWRLPQADAVDSCGAAARVSLECGALEINEETFHYPLHHPHCRPAGDRQRGVDSQGDEIANFGLRLAGDQQIKDGPDYRLHDTQ